MSPDIFRTTSSPRSILVENETSGKRLARLPRTIICLVFFFGCGGKALQGDGEGSHHGDEAGSVGEDAEATNSDGSSGGDSQTASDVSSGEDGHALLEAGSAQCREQEGVCTLCDDGSWHCDNTVYASCEPNPANGACTDKGKLCLACTASHSSIYQCQMTTFSDGGTLYEGLRWAEPGGVMDDWPCSP